MLCAVHGPIDRIWSDVVPERCLLTMGIWRRGATEQIQSVQREWICTVLACLLHGAFGPGNLFCPVKACDACAVIPGIIEQAGSQHLHLQQGKPLLSKPVLEKQMAPNVSPIIPIRVIQFMNCRVWIKDIDHSWLLSYSMLLLMFLSDNHQEVSLASPLCVVKIHPAILGCQQAHLALPDQHLKTRWSCSYLSMVATTTQFLHNDHIYCSCWENGR